MFGVRTLLALAIAAASLTAAAQDGRLDTSFGLEGVTILEVDSLGALTSLGDLERQSSGRLLVPFCIRPEGGLPLGFVAGITPDGDLDRSFAENGLLRFASPTCPNSIAISEDDGIAVVAGQVYNSGLTSYVTGVSNGVVIGYRFDGRLDSAFGTDGQATLPSAFAPQVITKDRDRFIVAGRVNRTAQPAAVRLKEDGELDQVFGDTGLAIGTGFVSIPSAVAVDDQGRIVIADEVVDPGGGLDPSSSGYVFRFTGGGAIDSTFGVDGRVQIPKRAANERVYAAVFDRAGAAIVAGAFGNYFGSAARATRLFENGSPDPDFNVAGLDGKCFPGAVLPVCTEITDLEVDDLGSLYVTLPSNGLVIGRLTDSGRFDSSFGNEGLVAAFPEGFRSGGRQQFVQTMPDRTVVALSSLRPLASGPPVIALARFIVGNPVASEPDALEDARLTVAPNPTTGPVILSLSLTEPTDIALEVFDVLGRLVIEDKLRLPAGLNDVDVGLEDAPAGVYLVRVRYEDTVQTAMVTVAR